MNKVELTEIIAAAHDIPKTKANDIICTLLSAMQNAVVRGDKVTLVGFGIFEAVHTQARTGHNPRTGEKIKIEATRRPKFTAGCTFKAAVKIGIE